MRRRKGQDDTLGKYKFLSFPHLHRQRSTWEAVASSLVGSSDGLMRLPGLVVALLTSTGGERLASRDMDCGSRESKQRARPGAKDDEVDEEGVSDTNTKVT